LGIHPCNNVCKIGCNMVCKGEGLHETPKSSDIMDLLCPVVIVYCSIVKILSPMDYMYGL
jgi:hypothetical protein